MLEKKMEFRAIRPTTLESVEMKILIPLESMVMRRKEMEVGLLLFEAGRKVGRFFSKIIDLGRGIGKKLKMACFSLTVWLVLVGLAVESIAIWFYLTDVLNYYCMVSSPFVVNCNDAAIMGTCIICSTAVWIICLWWVYKRERKRPLGLDLFTGESLRLIKLSECFFISIVVLAGIIFCAMIPTFIVTPFTAILTMGLVSFFFILIVLVVISVVSENIENREKQRKEDYLRDKEESIERYKEEEMERQNREWRKEYEKERKRVEEIISKTIIDSSVSAELVVNEAMLFFGGEWHAHAGIVLSELKNVDVVFMEYTIFGWYSDSEGGEADKKFIFNNLGGDQIFYVPPHAFQRRLDFCCSQLCGELQKFKKIKVVFRGKDGNGYVQELSLLLPFATEEQHGREIRYFGLPE